MIAAMRIISRNWTPGAPGKALIILFKSNKKNIGSRVAMPAATMSIPLRDMAAELHTYYGKI